MSSPHDPLGVPSYHRDPDPFETPRLSTLGLYFVAGVPAAVDRRGRERRAARPPLVRLCGALGGAIVTADPNRLRYEAGRLEAAAELLTRAQRPPAAVDPDQLDLFEARP